MSTKHPKLNAKQLIKILESKGFSFSRQNGSHAIYRNELGQRTTVPIHGKKELGIGLLRQIMKDTGLSIDDLTTI
jgi:predicted RNA binding protein YcfA (HicA-like mRNA interferase family)